MAVVVGFIPTEVGFKALTAAREEAEQRGGPLVVVNVLRAGVEEEKAELLVLGVRRQNDLARHLLGLTVQKLLLSSPSDVLVV